LRACRACARGTGRRLHVGYPTSPDATRPDRRHDQVIYYQYKHERARRTLRGIDEQVTKAERAVAGKVPIKRNRFIKLSGAVASPIAASTVSRCSRVSNAS
jgi:hypothetical protein